MSSSKTFYIREPRLDYPDHYRGKPVACVVYERYKDPDIEGEDYVIFAYSICAPGDEFVKAEGRRIATERLNDKESHLNGFTLPNDSSASAAVRQIMECMLADGGVPRRVKGNINTWLEEDAYRGVSIKIDAKPWWHSIAPVVGIILTCTLLGFTISSVLMAVFGG